jgi:hypothetical protein
LCQAPSQSTGAWHKRLDKYLSANPRQLLTGKHVDHAGATNPGWR